MAEETPSAASGASKPKVGCGPVIIFLIVLLVLLGVGGNAAFGHYLENCDEGEDLMDCMVNWANEPAPEGSVTASGPYTYKDYTVTLTLHIPLDGGKVTGTISGACDGMVKNASFTGQDNGTIAGKISGSCDPFFVKVPASATFGGTVNKEGKVVPISFSGKGAGFTHDGSMSLSY